MYRKHVKRWLDVVSSIMLMPLILPVVLLCAILIKIEDRGPVLYRGKRLGKDQCLFNMYKLRTMKVNSPDIRNADGSTFNSDKDPRLTRIGKFLRKTSLDELPQVLNVLIGDMSFIGPRPDLPEHILYYEDNEIRKLRILPGISGYSQAYYRNSAEWKQRLKNDIYYVENISFVLDVRIACKTILGVFMRKGIYVTTQTKGTEHYG